MGSKELQAIPQSLSEVIELPPVRLQVRSILMATCLFIVAAILVRLITIWTENSPHGAFVDRLPELPLDSGG